MSISLGFSPLLFATALIVAGALTYLTYHHTIPAVSRGKRWLLGGLRFTALALLLFLLLEPVLRRIDRDTRPPTLAVLIDDSQSLRVTTGTAGTDSSAAPRAAVAQTLQALALGEAPGTVRYFAFASGLRALGADARLDSLRFAGPRTDIAAALERVRETLQNDNLRGVVLLSDGQYNTGRNPLYLADRYPAPIYTVALGDTTQRRDVQVRRITTNDIGYVETELPLQIGIYAEEAGGARVTVALYRNGERLDATPITLPEGSAEVPANLTYTPTEAGLHRLTVRVTALENEVTPRNNERALTVRVLERKRRLLLLGAAPSPDFAAVRRLLARDTDTEVVPFVPLRNGQFLQGPLPDDLSLFDAIVLAGFPSAAVPASVVERVARAATEHERPLLFLLSQQTDLDAFRRHFGDLLPARPAQIRSGFVEALFSPAAAYQSHPILDIGEAPAALWHQLPPLAYNESRWTTSPDARVLATVEIRGVALGDPLLVIRERTGQRAAALLGAGTWRWANLPEDLDAASPLWPTLLNNTVEWITTQHEDRPVRVEPVQDTFAGSEAVSFTGQVYDESMNPVNDAAVQVNITAPDGTQYPYPMKAVGNGRYVLDAGSLPPGSYTFMAHAHQEGDTLGTDQGQFAVGALTLEYRNTRADVALLRQLAQRSDGAYLAAGTGASLSERLANRSSFAPLTITAEQEIRLWHVYGFLIVLIALLAAEWTLRKRNGMA